MGRGNEMTGVAEQSNTFCRVPSLKYSFARPSDAYAELPNRFTTREGNMVQARANGLRLERNKLAALERAEERLTRRIANIDPHQKTGADAPALRSAVTAAAVAIFTTFLACFRGLFTIIGEITAAVLTALLTCFGCFLFIVREVAWITFGIVAHGVPPHLSGAHLSIKRLYSMEASIGQKFPSSNKTDERNANEINMISKLGG